MWTNSRKRAWNCDRVNTPPAYTYLGLIWKHRSRPVWHGQRSFWDHPNCKLGSEIHLDDMESYCLIRQRCSPPFQLPIISFPPHQCLWYLERVLHMSAFLFVSLQVLLVRHATILPLWWGIHTPLICLAQLCSFSNPQSAGMTRANSLASSSMYFFHFSSLHSLDINIS